MALTIGDGRRDGVSEAKMTMTSGRRRGFQIHAFVFVAAINFSHGEPYWVIWPLLGWGIGIVAHWWFVLGPGAPAD